MVELTSALMTTMIGMLGVVIGAIVSNYVNQRIAAKSARRDLLFRKKVDYFDRTVESIEHNLKLYTTRISKLETKFNKKEIERALENLKKHRSKFEVTTSALYLNIELFTRGIKQFVAIEKQIFTLIRLLKAENHEKVMGDLRQVVRQLRLSGNNLIAHMRSNLMRE